MNKYNKFTTNDFSLDYNNENSYSIPKNTQSSKIRRIGKSKKTNQTTNKEKEIEKSVNIVNDIDKINEERINQNATKRNRNVFIIILLIILLMLILGSAVIVLKIYQPNPNCFISISGDCRAESLVNSEPMTEFRSTSEVAGGSIYVIDIDLRLLEEGEYNISFTVNCYVSGNRLEDVKLLPEEIDETLDGEGKYHIANVSGNSTINLFNEVYLSGVGERYLNVNNFKMEIKIYIEKI